MDAVHIRSPMEQNFPLARLHLEDHKALVLDEKGYIQVDDNQEPTVPGYIQVDDNQKMTVPGKCSGRLHDSQSGTVRSHCFGNQGRQNAKLGVVHGKLVIVIRR